MSLLFISYCNKDSDVAIEVQSFFMSTFGLTKDDVFLSKHSLSAGTPVEKRILSAIRDSKHLIYILSENYFQSPYCMCELGTVWGSLESTEKDPFMFLVNPINFNSDKFRSLPPSYGNTQSVVVRGGDEQQIKSYLEGMVEKIEVNAKGAGGYGVYGDKLIRLSKFLAESPHSVRNIDIRNAFAFHNPAGTQSALKISSNDTGKLSLLVDFSTLKPAFVGCAIPLNHQNWQHECSSGYNLSFNIQATEPLKELTLEIKGKNKEIIKSKDVSLTKELTRKTYKLSDLATSEAFKDMTELVFLFQPNDFEAISKVEISNVVIGLG